MKLFINASLPTSSNAMKKVNVLFDDKIVKISADEIVTEDAPEVIDLDGAIILPGAIDPHCHILDASSDPGKALQSVTKAAVQGGWTTVAELSYLYPQPLFDADALQSRKALISGNSHVDMPLWGHVNIDDYPYHAEAAQILWSKGVVGLALMSPSPNPAIADISFTEIMDLFMDIYESDTAFAFQGYDLEESKTYGLHSQNSAIKKLLRRSQENPIHIPRISSFNTIEFINSISKRSDITYSISLADMIELFDGVPHPGGFTSDWSEYQDMFFDLLRTNKIYILSNNTALPAPDVSEAYRGNPAELMTISYVWVLSEFWKRRKISLATCIKMLSENPAKRLGIYPVKGALEAGSDADFVIFDPEGKTNYKNSAGDSQTLDGAIRSVWLRGELAFAGKKTSNPTGEYLPRHNNPKRRHNKTTWI